MSNIIDFNQHKRDHLDEQPVDVVSMESLLRNLTELPKNGLMSSAAELAHEKLSRLLILTDIASKASDMLSAYGFDPDNFYLESDSLNRFLSGEMDEGEDALWNGPFFDWDADDENDTTVRVLTTVRTEEDDGDNVSMRLGLEIFKLGSDDENWWRFNSGEWTHDGPPADIFDNLDALGYLDDDDDDDDDDDEDEDWDDDEDEEWDDEEDEWADDDDEFSIYMYDFGDKALRALTLAGIETVDQVQALTDEQLAAMPGMDERSVARVKRVLAFLED